MIKYNPTKQNTKKYLSKLSYSKCKNCGLMHYPALDKCNKCGKDCISIDTFRSIKLISYTKIYHSQKHFDKKKPIIIGLIRLNNELDITGEVVDIKFRDLRTRMQLKPVMRIIFKDKLLGYIQYGIKFTKTYVHTYSER